MDAKRLSIFRSVARAGSIAAAARELGWTQPAVSQHMRALEHEVGHPLLIRRHDGVGLTQAGQALLARADELAALLAATQAEQADFSALKRGTVRLAVFPSAAATIVPRAITLLRASYPALDLTLTEAEPDDALRLLVADEADIAMVFRYPPEPDDLPPGILARRLGEEPVTLVAAASHRFTGDRTMASLADESWIAGCPRCRDHLVGLCRAAGFVPRIKHSTDDYVVVQHLAAADVGISLLPAAALTAFRHPGVQLVYSAAWGTRVIGALVHETARTIPAVAAALAAFAQACE